MMSLSYYSSNLSLIALKTLRLLVQSWPEWDSKPQPCAYRAHALTTEISGRTIRRALF